MAQGNPQYTPGPVPNTGNAQLEQYLSAELERIRAELSIDVYGGLDISSAKLLSATATPQVITAWGGSSPTKPEGTILSTTNGTIDVNVDGVYFCAARIAVVINGTSANHYVDLYANGAATGLRGFIYGGFLPAGYFGVVFDVQGFVDVSGPTQFDLRYSRAGVGPTPPPSAFWIGDADWTIERIGG